MNVRCFILVLFVIASSTPLHGEALLDDADESILFVYEEFPPFYIERDGGVTGLFGGKAKQVFDAADLSVTWQQVSFKRLMDMLETSPKRVCTAGYGWKAERTRHMQFSIKFADGPPSVVVAHKDAAAIVQKYQGLGELIHDERLKGVFLNLPFSHEYFSELPILKKNHVFVTAEDAQLFEMVRTGRVDYTFLNNETALYLNSKFALADRVVIVPLEGLTRGYDRFILCTRSVSELEMQKLNNGIKQVEESAR